MVVRRSELTGEPAGSGRHSDDLEAAGYQPVELLGNIFGIDPVNARQDVDDFADIDRSDHRRRRAQERLDLVTRPLTAERRHKREGVENGQRSFRERSRFASSRRMAARTTSLGERKVFSDPRAAAIGSSGSGRSSSESPRSSRSRRSVLHRRRTVAGTEI